MRLIHSYSALKLYEQCGLRYYRQRILKDVYEQDTVYSTHGNEVHKAIENKLKNGTPVPKELSAYGKIIEMVERSAEKTGRTIAVEQGLGLDRSFNATDYWGGDIWVRAKLDVVLTGGPEAVIIDWKTGKRKLDFTQLKIAAVALMAANPTIHQVITSFAWMKDKILDKRIYAKADSKALISEIAPRFAAIEEANVLGVWTPKPGYLCNYCPCKPTCNYASKR